MRELKKHEIWNAISHLLGSKKIDKINHENQHLQTLLL